MENRSRRRQEAAGSRQEAGGSANVKPTTDNGQPTEEEAEGEERSSGWRFGSSAVQETRGIPRAAVNFLGLSQKPRSARRDAEVCQIQKARRTWWFGDPSRWLFKAALLRDALSQTPELVCAGLGELCMTPDGAVCRAEVEHGFSGVFRHRHQTSVVA